MWGSDVCILIAFGLDSIVLSLLIVFFKFHLDLVVSNTTTIENLERKKSPLNPETYNPYDKGTYFNWI